jgi:hypothetical protein
MFKRFWKNYIHKPIRSFRTRGLTKPGTNNNGRDEIEVTDTTSSDGDDPHILSPAENNYRSSEHRTSISSPAPKGLFSSVGARAGQQMKHGISQFGVKPMEMIQEDLHNGVRAVDKIANSFEKIANTIQGFSIVPGVMVILSFNLALNTLPHVGSDVIYQSPVTMMVNQVVVILTYYMIFLVVFIFSHRELMQYCNSSN